MNYAREPKTSNLLLHISFEKNEIFEMLNTFIAITI